MYFRNKIILITTLLIGMVSARADDINNTQEQSVTTANSIEQAAQSGTASDWNLTAEEWRRYQQFMQGVDSLWYGHLSPPAVLGMRADTQEEQRHFAEIVAKQEHDKVTRELAFNHAVLIAMRSLYPDEPMIRDFDKTSFNPSQGMKKNNNVVLRPGDRLVLFEAVPGMDIAVLPKLLAVMQANPKINLDIYCVGSTDDSVIRQWAALNHIPAPLVNSGRITLNQDDGRLAKTAGQPKLPYLLLLRAGQSKPVSAWDL